MNTLSTYAYFILPVVAAVLILCSFDCYETSKKKERKGNKWFKKFSLGMAIYFLILGSYIIKLFFCWHY